jgi:malonyl CoA-acyl carrier protein transacylase
MTKHNDYNNDNNSTDGDELLTDRIDERRRAEQQRLLTEIAQSTQDASDELRLMNDNVENLTREVHGTKEAIKSLTDVLRKYFDNRNQDKNHNNKA